ncbi:FAD-dependent oxidoreductase [Nocardioides sp. ChNu-99]|uniref:NAD(P)/FAD-dependent oxidoreductase n=1 Tax=Nocardioides sp. ChNu-99 TaxID=2839897 RepID=UPI0024069693|nr:FAD-dependent oxidoreductase [Nocardioides sp. ChNu-99]MDF9717260.1 NAD(P)/FAD-dependent oxidoreductase [Nocardioides sp. ChNu-99]
MSATPPTHVSVAVVGGGPAGLTAATALAGALGPGAVLVLDREREAGGIPRHSDHTGYGMRDLHRVARGPAYARTLVERATAAGAVIETGAMVTGWAGERTLEVTAPTGRRTVTADAVVLATGARERARPARWIPGDRPDGVLTTGQLQNLVHLHHRPVGKRAVVIGGELVSWSAVLTLREAGCRTVAMVTEHPRSESYAAFRLAGRLGLRVPVLARSRVVAIEGRGRVTGVVVEDADGARRTVPCDLVVTTGDWIPDHELARLNGLELDRGTRGPVVDAALRTSAPGVFAAGNLLHPVDTADVAALDGRHVATAVLDWLGRGAAAPSGVRLRVEAPLRWIAPQVVDPGGPPPARGRLLLWTDEHVARPRVEVVQDGTVVTRRRLPWPAAPGRVFRVPSAVLDGVRRDGGDVTLRLG